MTAIADTAAVSIVQAVARPAAHGRALVGFADIPAAQMRLRPAIAAALAAQKLKPSGPTFTLWSLEADGRLDLRPGVIVDGFRADGEIVPGALPAGRAAHLLLTGGFHGLGGAWGRLFAACEAKGLKRANLNWEIYRDGGQPGAEEIELYTLLA